MKIDFEYFMQEKHAEQYIGLKSAMVDDFYNWVDDEVSAEDWIRYGNEFAEEVLLKIKKGVKNG